jgi:hypothetical protein
VLAHRARKGSPSFTTARHWTVYGHLGDVPVAVRAVDVGLCIDQHAVGGASRNTDDFRNLMRGEFVSQSVTNNEVAQR